MGKIDGDKYPDLDPESAVEIADILVNTFGGEPSSEEAFAQEVGHSSSDSGAYRGKMADMRRYGLVTSRGLKPTDLAHQVANPRNEDERRDAIFRMLRNISLLSRLYDHLDGQTPSGDFWRILTEITSANPKDAREASGEIQGLYQKMLRFEPSDDDTEDETEIIEDKSGKSKIIGAPSEDGILIQVGDDHLKLNEVTETNLEMARLFIESKKRIVTTQQMEDEEESSNDSEQLTLG